MYEDNAWPDTAPIETFIPERKRPQKVFVAAIAVMAVGVLALLLGVLHAVTASNASSTSAPVVLAIPAALAVGIEMLVAAWLAIVATGMLKGRKWVPKPARWTGGVAAAWYVLFGLLMMSAVGSTHSAGLGGFVAFLSFAAAVAGAVAAICMVGKGVDEYFDPPVQPNPFQNNTGQPPVGGYDADWVPPAQRQPPHNGYGNSNQQ